MCVNLPLGVSIPHTHPDNCSRRRATSHIKPQSLFCLQPPWKLSLHNTFFPRDSSAEINVVFSFIKDKAAHSQFLTSNSFFFFSPSEAGQMAPPLLHGTRTHAATLQILPGGSSSPIQDLSQLQCVLLISLFHTKLSETFNSLFQCYISLQLLGCIPFLKQHESFTFCLLVFFFPPVHTHEANTIPHISTAVCPKQPRLKCCFSAYLQFLQRTLL